MEFIKQGDPIEKKTAVTKYLSNYFDIPVALVFTDEVKNFLIDYFNLKDQTENQNIEYYDYSFVLLPLCKALEKHLFNILRAIGYIAIIPTKEYDITQLGTKMKEDKKMDSLKIFLKDHGCSDEIIKSTLTKIREMSEFWHTHRNLPLHVDGLCIPSLSMAEGLGSEIIHEMNSFTAEMTKTGINEYLNKLFK